MRAKVISVVFSLPYFLPFLTDSPFTDSLHMQKLVILPCQIETPHRHHLTNFPPRRNPLVSVDKDHQPDGRCDSFPHHALVTSQKTLELPQPGKRVVRVDRR